MSHPPVKPSPDLLVCLDCGSVEFSISPSWLSAGWLRPMRPRTVSAAKPAAPVSEVAARSLVSLSVYEVSGD